MVSGIGPKAQLAKFNIKPIAINENVGQGMQDHIFVGPTYPITPATGSFTKVAANPLYLAAQLANFTLSQLGPLTNHVADLLSWERPSDAQLASIGASKLSSYPADYPLLEGFSAPGVVGNFANLLSENMAAGFGGKQFATILFALVAPQSRGTITLASADMADAPIIDPRWLTDPVDQALAIYAFKRARQYFAANAMKPILAGIEYLPGPAVQTDAQILAWIQNNLMTVWHASCTTSMRTKENGGVLDNRLRVYGERILRLTGRTTVLTAFFLCRRYWSSCRRRSIIPKLATRSPSKHHLHACVSNFTAAVNLSSFKSLTHHPLSANEPPL
jgi:choline dehydrogenase